MLGMDEEAPRSRGQHTDAEAPELRISDVVGDARAALADVALDGAPPPLLHLQVGPAGVRRPQDAPAALDGHPRHRRRAAGTVRTHRHGGGAQTALPTSTTTPRMSVSLPASTVRSGRALLGGVPPTTSSAHSCPRRLVIYHMISMTRPSLCSQTPTPPNVVKPELSA